MKASETLSGWKYRLPVQFESDNPFRPGTLLSGSYRVLSRGMAKQPADRYPSTLALMRALERAMVSDGLLTKAHPQGLPAYLYADGGDVEDETTRENIDVGLATREGDGYGQGDNEGPGGQRELDKAALDESEALGVCGPEENGSGEATSVGHSMQEQPAAAVERDQGLGIAAGDVDDDLDEELASIGLRRFRRRTNRRRLGSARKAAASVVGIAFGFLAGMMALSRFETRADNAWNGVRDLVVRSAGLGISKSHQWIGRSLGRNYLSAEQKQ